MTLLPEYRAQLYAAAHERARGRAAPAASRWRPRVGPRFRALRAGWPVALSAVIVAGIVTAALAVLGHRQGASSARSKPVPTASIRQLVDVLGVLRRPQTSADLHTPLPGFLMLPSPPICRTARYLPRCTFRADTPLIRTVAVPGTRYRVGIFPVITHPVPARPQTVAGVALTLSGPGIYRAASGPWAGGAVGPGGLNELRARGALLSAYVTGGLNRGVLVVPDGVARVIIGPVRLLDHSIATRPVLVAGMSAVVHDNVALFQLGGLTVEQLRLDAGKLGKYFSQGSGHGCRIDFAVYAVPASARMFWLGPQGSVIRHPTVSFPLYVATRHVPARTVADPLCARRGYRIATAR